MTHALRHRLALGSSFLIASGLILTCRTAASAPRAAAPVQDDVQAGIAQFKNGNFAAAEAALRNASGPDASAYLAASLAKQKKYAEAEGTARSAVAARPTHEVAVAALGESLVGQKKFDEAIQAMSAAIDAKADLAYAYFWRGQGYDNKRQPAKMAADYQEFLRLAPKAPEAPAVQAILSGLR
jgi:tetratricopeptide (TPR) repeat protein